MPTCPLLAFQNAINPRRTDRSTGTPRVLSAQRSILPQGYFAAIRTFYPVSRNVRSFGDLCHMDGGKRLRRELPGRGKDPRKEAQCRCDPAFAAFGHNTLKDDMNANGTASARISPHGRRFVCRPRLFFARSHLNAPARARRREAACPVRLRRLSLSLSFPVCLQGIERYVWRSGSSSYPPPGEGCHS